MIKRKNIAKFWYDVSLTAGQVTFGVLAASWFVSLFDLTKKIVLIINGLATIIFLWMGYKFTKKL
jgi:hypothetical protein